MNLAGLLGGAARRFGDRPALSWRGSTLTYEELDERVTLVAGALAMADVGLGDRVVLYMDNRPEVLEVMFASFRAGAVVVPCNSRSTADELAFIVDDCEATLVVADEAHVDTARAGADGCPVVVTGDDYESRLQGCRGTDPVPVADVDPDHIAWLFYTSGTTGKPKGAMLSHGVLNFVVVAWHADLLPLDEHDITLHVAPLSHGAGFHAMAAASRGVHQRITSTVGFDPVAVLDEVREHGVTNMWVVPTQIIRLTEAREGSDPVPSLRRVLYGGAPITPAAIARALDAFGPIFVQLYGQGETPMTITVLGASEHRDGLLETVGYPRLGVDVAVLDADGHLLPDGEIGEVAVRGPSVMSGYWKRPDATAAALAGGWLRTGDVGRFSDTGALTLLDRTKDVIISGGSNVYAAEVESVLASAVEVQDVAVIGVPDELWGERVEAVVVLDVPADIGVLSAALEQLCRTKLSSYKVPRRFHVADALPRNAYGKVLKQRLRAELASVASVARAQDDG